MSRRAVIALAGVAVVVRVAALAYVGNPFDMNTFQLVAGTLFAPGRWHLYADPSLFVRLYSGQPEYLRWPYPGGYLPVVAAAQWTAAHVGGPFNVLIRLPSLMLDFAVAVAVFRILRPRSERLASAGAAVILLGPVFIAISSLHGQLDTLAMLPVLGAFAAWEHLPPGGRRALAAGALIGLGAAIKSFPLVFLLALVPTASGAREVVYAAAAAAAVVVLSLVPFVLAEPGAVVSGLAYGGVVGIGGISMLLQPSLAEDNFGQILQPHLSGLSQAAAHVAGPLTAVALLAATAWLRGRRSDPWASGVLVCGVVFVAGLNFAFQYGLWAIVLLLAQGRIRAAVATQAALCVPAFFSYTAIPIGGYGRLPVDLLYLPVMAILPFAFLALGVDGVRRAPRRGGARARPGGDPSPTTAGAAPA